MATGRKLVYATKRGTPFGPSLEKRAVMYSVAQESADKGLKAFQEGIDIERCPYPSNSVNQRAWCEAWLGAEERTRRMGTIIVE